ncbi:FtsW/RodA/SpoVE family cell cycle protein [Bacillus sp. JJ722]|uniref:FtsW/RodA/SpoVE family cell cycle protein n=1 Tax=Bacillus sp. JJ722 TaxID=3122973 RepID=UPI002FFE52F1
MLKKIVRSYDLSLIVTIIALSIFGLVMIYSASMIVAPAKYEVDSDYFYIKQIKNLIVAAIMFGFFAIVPYKLYQHKYVLMGIVFSSIFVLLILDIFGHTANNAQSWLDIAGTRIQPSEFIKLGVIIYLSAIYAKKQKYIDNFNAGVLPPLFFLVIVCALIFFQPDFGTALIISLIAATIILSSGMSLKSLLKLVGILVLAVLLVVPFIFFMKDQIFTENRMGRLYSFVEPFKYEEKEGYQLVNSYIAIGSGGVSGSGLGNSIQKYGYLPEPHTDFIMAVISEELGAKGVLFVLGCLSFIILRGFRIAVKCRDPFGSLLAIGISSMIGIQSFINLGGVTGLIPITGVTLPFVSYGGSSIVILAISMGVLVNVSMFTNYENKYKLNSGEKVIAS